MRTVLHLYTTQLALVIVSAGSELEVRVIVARLKLNFDCGVCDELTIPHDYF